MKRNSRYRVFLHAMRVYNIYPRGRLVKSLRGPAILYTVFICVGMFVATMMIILLGIVSFFKDTSHFVHEIGLMQVVAGACVIAFLGLLSWLIQEDILIAKKLWRLAGQGYFDKGFPETIQYRKNLQ